MPQMNKGGKFIFGKSLIRNDLTVHLPKQAIDEYDITSEEKLYLFTGSKSTGGFCVTRRGLLGNSKLSHILADMQTLDDYSEKEGRFIKYKGRSYCWISVSMDGVLQLTTDIMKFLCLEEGMKLLSIRSSDIAFTMGAKGPLLGKADNFDGVIPEY